MKHLTVRFLSDEHGAVTLDWVVLTASIVALGVGAIALLININTDMGVKIGNSLSGAEVVTVDLLPKTSNSGND